MVAGDHPRRYTARIEGPFVVFLIGMRINRPLAVRRWLPIVLAMPRMIREVERDAEAGFLGARYLLAPRGAEVVQYWRSFAHLEAYARDPAKRHRSAWTAFNRQTDGAVGVWHETYLVPAGGYECVYRDMPRHGLSAVAERVAADDRFASAAERVRGIGAERTGGG